MDVAHGVGYGVARYIVFPLIGLGAIAFWAYLKKQKNNVSENYEQHREDRIKNKYRKELEEKELVERLKREVHEERGEKYASSLNNENKFEPDATSVILECPHCAQKLRIPVPPPSIYAICPGCKQKISVVHDGKMVRLDTLQL